MHTIRFQGAYDRSLTDQENGHMSGYPGIFAGTMLCILQLQQLSSLRWYGIATNIVTVVVVVVVTRSLTRNTAINTEQMTSTDTLCMQHKSFVKLSLSLK